MKVSDLLETLKQIQAELLFLWGPGGWAYPRTFVEPRLALARDGAVALDWWQKAADEHHPKRTADGGQPTADSMAQVLAVVREAAWAAHEQVGDGTTTAALMTVATARVYLEAWRASRSPAAPAPELLRATLRRELEQVRRRWERVALPLQQAEHGQVRRALIRQALRGGDDTLAAFLESLPMRAGQQVWLRFASRDGYLQAERGFRLRVLHYHTPSPEAALEGEDRHGRVFFLRTPVRDLPDMGEGDTVLVPLHVLETRFGGFEGMLMWLREKDAFGVVYDPARNPEIHRGLLGLAPTSPWTILGRGLALNLDGETAAVLLFDEGPELPFARPTLLVTMLSRPLAGWDQMLNDAVLSLQTLYDDQHYMAAGMGVDWDRLLPPDSLLRQAFDSIRGQAAGLYGVRDDVNTVPEEVRENPRMSLVLTPRDATTWDLEARPWSEGGLVAVGHLRLLRITVEHAPMLLTFVRTQV